MKTSELTGAALDWAVAKCEGATEEWRSGAPFLWDGVPCIRIDGHDVNYRPSTSWLLAGPILEREEMGVQCIPAGTRKGWWALVTSRFHDRSSPDEIHGDTPLIAAMRCYVASKLGDEVEIPTALTQGETA